MEVATRTPPIIHTRMSGPFPKEYDYTEIRNHWEGYRESPYYPFQEVMVISMRKRMITQISEPWRCQQGNYHTILHWKSWQLPKEKWQLRIQKLVRRQRRNHSTIFCLLSPSAVLALHNFLPFLTLCLFMAVHKY